MDDKPSWYYLRNSQGQYDGLWTLAVYSFVFIMIISAAALISWIATWANYYALIERANPKVIRSIKPPGLKFAEVAGWVSAFGGLVLAPVIAGYVARRNEMLKPERVIERDIDRTPVEEDDGH